MRVEGRVGRVTVWSSGGALQAWRRGDVEVWSSGALEAYCTCSDVEEAERFETLEMRCGRIDVETLEVWRSGALEARCRRVDIEM